VLHLIRILISAIVLVVLLTSYSKVGREHQVDIRSLYKKSERILYLDTTITTF